MYYQVQNMEMDTREMLMHPTLPFENINFGGVIQLNMSLIYNVTSVFQFQLQLSTL